jgi:hypothetical protein
MAIHGAAGRSDHNDMAIASNKATGPTHRAVEQHLQTAQRATPTVFEQR